MSKRYSSKQFVTADSEKRCKMLGWRNDLMSRECAKRSIVGNNGLSNGTNYEMLFIDETIIGSSNRKRTNGN